MMIMCLPLMLDALGTLPLNSGFPRKRFLATVDCLEALFASHLELNSG